MSSNKKYWTSLEELNGNPVVEKMKNKEFAEEIPVDEFLGDKESLENSSTSRRDFLKLVGFSTAAATLAACEGPVTKTIPYVVQPERIVPGIPDYYATTMADGFDFASVLVKTREARPIKIEKNYLSKTNMGVNARVHASVLSLYDNQRLKRPKANGENVSWEDFDRQVQAAMQGSRGETVLLTRTFASPSTNRAIKEFALKNGNVRHVIYDAVSEDDALNAYQQKYGIRALPNYDFSKAETIVSIGADFLGDWQGGGYHVGYAKSRVPKDGKMSRHIQFESNVSGTGANADKRILATPSEQIEILKAFHAYVTGGSSAKNKLTPKQDDAVVKALRQLRKAGKGAVVVTGVPGTKAQIMALEINEALGSQVMNANEPRMIRQGNAEAVKQLVKDMNAGRVGTILIAGVNPAYSLPNAKEFIEGLKKTGVSIAFTMKEDETAKLCNFLAATPHYLESWGDVQFTRTHFSLMQPTIRPLFDTRQFEECLLKWSGNDISYYDFVKQTWNQPVGDTGSNSLGGKSWNQALHDGVFTATQPAGTEGLNSAGGNISRGNMTFKPAKKDSNEFELVLYTSTGLGDGQQANNPWLQELPDPITRTTWDNFISISRADAERLDLENYIVDNGGLNGSRVNVKMGGIVLENVPVLIQPGQAKGTIGMALGYGKKEGIQKEMQTGINAYPLYQDFNNFQTVSLEKVGGDHEFAAVQLQHTLAGRKDVLRETTLETFLTKPKDEWNKDPKVSYAHNEVDVRSDKADIWTSYDTSIGHHFNMSIDLNACTGCGACVIACHSENNVPVVGKEQVRKFRDMHWLRIDRYYSSAETFEEGFDQYSKTGLLESYNEVEQPDENPQMAFQPVMCQHCNHAPCETVCPVAAISHGRQGQNQMVYNRCVGTRYCANNCPYKVRRFNWFLWSSNDEFDYHMNNDLGRMVLNPDVVVRSRGVMEKCSLCIQLTQQTILTAKREGREVKEGEFHTACSRACDSGAIVFGDVNMEGSEINEKKNDDRRYYNLGYLGTQPNVMYQTKIRNTTEV